MRAQSRFVIQIRNFWVKAGLLILLALIAPSIVVAQQPISTCSQLQQTPHTALIGQGNAVPNSQTSDSFQVSLAPGDKLVCTATVNTTNPPPNNDDPFWNLIKTGQGGNQSLVGGPGNNFQQVQSFPTGTYQNLSGSTQSPVIINAGIDTGQPRDPKGASYNLSCTCQPGPTTGKLTINKVTIGGDGTFDVLADGATDFNYSIPTNNGNGSVSKDVPPGSYVITETPPAGWSLESIVCGQGGSTATVTLGQETVCTVTNKKKAKLTIKKQTINGFESFPFTGTGPGPFSGFTETTTIAGQTSTGTTQTNLTPGAYVVSETMPDATWSFTGISCSGAGVQGIPSGAAQANITLAPGADGTCVFQNTKADPAKGSIIIEKSTPGSQGSFSFSTTGAGFNVGPIDTTVANPNSQTVTNLAPGSYSVTEIVPAGWDLTSIVCTAGGTTDLNANKANIALLAGQTVKCTFVNTKQVGQLTLAKTPSVNVYSAVGQVIDYQYTVANAGNQTLTNVAITDDKIPVVTCPSTTLNVGASMVCTGSYTITQADLTSCVVKNVATASGTFGNQNVTATANATVKCDPDRTREVIRNFLNRRVDLLASNEPDRARLMRRFERPQQQPSSLKDGPMKLTGESEGGSTRMSFATSLSQIAQANASSVQAKAEEVRHGNGMMGLGSDAAAFPATAVTSQTFDVWAEGHYQRFDDEIANADRDGRFGILYVGADYLVSPWFLVGALVQFDWMDDDTRLGAAESRVDGWGWMAGPYISMKLSPNVFFDARGAWGQSDNDISPFGTYTDSFETDRWLAKANLTGNWNIDRLRVSPSVGVIYVEESQDTYVDSIGNTIFGQSAHIGRLTFGPEFGYPIPMSNGNVLEPHISFTGMWDFDKTGHAEFDEAIASTDDFRVKVEGGLILKSYDGISLRGTVSYDGLGASDYEAWGGQLWANVPLN